MIDKDFKDFQITWNKPGHLVSVT